MRAGRPLLPPGPPPPQPCLLPPALPPLPAMYTSPPGPPLSQLGQPGPGLELDDSSQVFSSCQLHSLLLQPVLLHRAAALEDHVEHWVRCLPPSLPPPPPAQEPVPPPPSGQAGGPSSGRGAHRALPALPGYPPGNVIMPSLPPLPSIFLLSLPFFPPYLPFPP